MATDTYLKNLIINSMKKAKYEELEAAGQTSLEEIYLLEDDDDFVGDLDNAVLITIEDIDKICGGGFVSARSPDVTF